MVNEFCGFKHGVIGTDKMPADTTLNNMKKADLIKLLHTAQHNYETLMYFYNNAVKVNMSQLNNNGWIPCSERLPEEYGEYLCCDKYGEYIIGYPTARVSSDDYYVETEYEIMNDCIAWQPLPTPYKEGCEQVWQN